MKKFIFIVAAAFCFSCVNAQTAIQESKILDNTYVGAGVGVTTPLDFNSVFPLNEAFTVKVGKEVTPVVGFELEGIALFNDNHFGDFKTGVKATNLGGALTLNIGNLFWGYKGKPRWLELKTNTGIGWMHTFDETRDAMTAKTAVDVVWNIGKSRAFSVVVTPGVYWDLTRSDKAAWGCKFNKHCAQFSLMGTVVWHFKTSNGTRYFKKYDVGAMEKEIARLTAELEKKPKEVIVEKTVEKVVEKTVRETVNAEYYVMFAWNSYELDSTAKSTLDKVKGKVKVVAYASPEGEDGYNKDLSQKRADAVAAYLGKNGIEVTEAVGLGVNGETSNRVAIVTVQ